MAKEPLNNIVPVKKQIWEHVVTKQQFVIFSVSDDDALCALLDKDNDNAMTKLRVLVPLNKFFLWGNRGMAMVGTYSGKLPVVKGVPGQYNPRNKLFGAL